MAISQIVQNSLANTISLGPKITSVQVANSSYTVLDDTSINIGGGYIVITGSGFQSNCSVIVDSNLACSVAFVSATQVRAQLPAKAAGTYNIYLLNGDGGTAIRVNALQYSNTPTWVTTSPLADQAEDSNVSIQLSATGANTYALQTGSTLPNGLTLSANGLISGTVNTNVSTATTYNFTVEAIDTENQETPKAFAVTITVQSQVSRSLRFTPGDSTYLSRTPGSTGNRKTWTWSGWLKRSTITNDYQRIFSARGAAGELTEIVFNHDGGSENTLVVENYISSSQSRMVTNAVFRDVSAWYHIVVAYDTTQATNTNRVKLWVNGVQQTFGSGTYPTLNQDTYVNTTYEHRIGTGIGYEIPFSGYMAEIHFVDGQALTPDTFGKWDNGFGGTWVPKTVTGVTYGTNGYYLSFSDNSGTTSTTLGKDSAGSNNWTPNNFSVTAGNANDSLVDSPTPYGTDDGSGADVRGSYAVFNPLSTSLTLSYQTITDGCLKLAGSSASNSGQAYLTAALPKTGKYYLEFVMTAMGDGYTQIGINEEAYMFPDLAGGSTNYAQPGYTADTVVYQNNGTLKLNNTDTGSWGATFTTNDVIGMAIDCDNGAIYFSKNGTWQNSGVPTSGASKTGAAKTWTGGTKIYHIGVAVYKSTHALYVNSGQRPFAYTAPSGYVTVNTQNLTPGIDANTSSTLANSYFGVVTYTGTGSELNVTGLNFDPDFVWIKMRSSGDVHVLVDKVRGDDGTRMYVLNTDNTSTEALRTESTTAVVKSSSWPSNGFRVGGNGQTNSSGGTYVAFAWKANGSSTVTNTSGSISSNVSFNSTTKFSIVKYTSPNNSGNQTVGHGLGVKPAFIIVKNRDSSANWDIYHKDLGYNASLTFSGAATRSGAFGAEPTDTLFTTVNNYTHYLTDKFVAYCWAEVAGFSKFGMYYGNGNANGPFVYCGFRPAFVMVKRTNNTYDWKSWNSGSLAYNPNDRAIWPNLNNAEGTGHPVDFLSNGFKIRGTDPIENSSGAPYIFAAWAETPFKNARAR